MLRIALRSLANRRLTASLTVAAVALSVALLLGVEAVRTGAKSAFANTISGADLIVGARSGPLQLLLYSVFRIGSPTANMSWQSYRTIGGDPRVAWAVPISLGDSHRGFRVLGTSRAYFDRYRYRGDRRLELADGERFDDLFDATIGWDVAKTLDYRIGDAIVVAHGLGEVGFAEHDDKPFRVSGILAKTGTPVDRTVHVSLEAITAIHVDWRSGARIPGRSVGADEVRNMDLEPETVTAAFVGLKSKLAAFRLQRAINTFEDEPLSAVIPGVALQRLWSLIGTAEQALSAVAAMAVATALLGLVATVFASLNERRREMAILRAVGAGPRTVFGLLLTEAMLLTLAGIAFGMGLVYAVLFAARPWIEAEYGLFLPIRAPGEREAAMLAGVAVAGLVAGLLPAIRAYRLSLADGMNIRV